MSTGGVLGGLAVATGVGSVEEAWVEVLAVDILVGGVEL